MRNLVETEFDKIVKALNEAGGSGYYFDNPVFKAILKIVNECLDDNSFGKRVSFRDGSVGRMKGDYSWLSIIRTDNPRVKTFAIKLELANRLAAYKDAVILGNDQNNGAISIRIKLDKLADLEVEDEADADEVAAEAEAIGTLTTIDEAISTEAPFDTIKSLFDFWNTHKVANLNVECMKRYNSIDSKLKAIIDSKSDGLLKVLVDERNVDPNMAWIVCLQYFYNAYKCELEARDFLGLSFVTDDHEGLHKGNGANKPDFNGDFLGQQVTIELKCCGSINTAQELMDKDGTERDNYFHDAQFILFYIINTNEWLIAQNVEKLSSKKWISLGKHYVQGLRSININNKNRVNSFFPQAQEKKQ